MNGQLSKLSVPEAAFAAHVSAKTVINAIDRKLLRATARREERGMLRYLSVRDVLVFVIEHRTASWVTINRRARRQLQVSVDSFLSQVDTTLWTSPEPEWRNPLLRILAPIRLGSIVLDSLEILGESFESLRRISKSREIVVSDPEIRAGEPIVRNTRIPVYLLADLRGQGADDDELLDDYPALTADALSAALLWADLHQPPRQPARKAPWRRTPGRVLLAASEGPMRAPARGSRA